MENQENKPLNHAAEENQEREQTQRITPNATGDEGNSVFGASARIVSHRTGTPLEEAAQPDPEPTAAAPLRNYGQDATADTGSEPPSTNPGGDLINNTGADHTGSGADADAASG